MNGTTSGTNLTSGTKNKIGVCKIMNNSDSSRSWFCVLNNPSDCYEGEPQQIAESALEDWVKDKPTERKG